MAKLPFFKFEAESWLTGKVQVLNVEQIGIYANLTARVWRDGGSVENSRFLPRMLGCTEEQWQKKRAFRPRPYITRHRAFFKRKKMDSQGNIYSAGQGRLGL